MCTSDEGATPEREDMRDDEGESGQRKRGLSKKGEILADQMVLSNEARTTYLLLTAVLPPSRTDQTLLRPEAKIMGQIPEIIRRAKCKVVASAQPHGPFSAAS